MQQRVETKEWCEVGLKGERTEESGRKDTVKWGKGILSWEKQMSSRR